MSNSSRHASLNGGSSDGSADEFTLLDEPQDLVIRSKGIQPDCTLRIELNPIEHNRSFLLSIHPPAKPVETIKHVGCDIVLVIDISGSMSSLAPLPDAEIQQQEASNLTVLDLVRHACRTIISTLNEGDRLALITFSQDAEVVQSLTPMTAKARTETWKEIKKLKAHGPTNLWAGIKAGIRQYEEHADIGNVQGLFVLTDGQPNLMCPPQGYARKLTPLLDSLLSTPTIQTFGFGYDIRSDLMLSIAKVGNGNYAFIPDVGMIGTAFVHAVANLYSTYATNASLKLTAPTSSVKLEHNSGLPCEKPSRNSLLIKLGNLQYGQSRDLVIFHRHARWLRGSGEILAEVSYTQHHQPSQMTSMKLSLDQPPMLSQLSLHYHYYRNSLCQFLSAFYPVDSAKDQHSTTTAEDINDRLMNNFSDLVAQLSRDESYRTDPNLSSLLYDLVGPSLDPTTPEQGQIHQALQTASRASTKSRTPVNYWQKWGRHYLSSLWCAHMRQTCNTFKDAGPLRYGVDSELFKRSRDELDQAFDNLPAPVGTHHESVSSSYSNRKSCISPGTSSVTYTPPPAYTPISMRDYNRAEAGCFSEDSSVTLADGTRTTVKNLRVGMSIFNRLTNTHRKITGIVKTIIDTTTATQEEAQEQMCLVGDENLWITPWHPIFDIEQQAWVFPHSIARATRCLRDGEAVYSVLLEPSARVDDHVLEVGGVACVTLGHGLVGKGSGDAADVRAHPFFGDHARIEACLSCLSVDNEGRRLSAGLVRDCRTGLTCGMAAVGPEVATTAGVDKYAGVSVSVTGLGASPCLPGA